MTYIFPGVNNFVKRIVFHDCARPWWVYVETFVPCFLQLVLTLAAFGWDDFVVDVGRNYGKGPLPGTGRGGRHGRLKNFHAEPDHLKAGFKLGLKWVLYLDLPLEYIGWHWLLYGATDHFFYEWMTLIQTSRYCSKTVGSGPLMRSVEASAVFPNPDGGAVPLPILNSDRGGWGSNSLSAGLPDGFFFGTFCVQVEGGGGAGYTCKLRLHLVYLGVSWTIDGDEVTLIQGVPNDLLVSGDWHVPTSIAASVSWEIVGDPIPVGLQVISAYVTIVTTD